MEIKIVVCDDEPYFVKHVHNIIMQLTQNINIIIKTYSYIHGKDLLIDIKNGFVPDIVFLDINLKDSMGTNIGSVIKSFNPETLLIYMSSYDCYDKQIIKSEPFYFLEKPIKISEFSKTFSNAIRRACYIKHEISFTYKLNGILYQVNTKNILYFESKHRIIYIHLKDGKTQRFYGKLDIVETDINKLCDYFVRANKSFLINSLYITKLSLSYLSIEENNINISPKYREKLYDKINLYK